MDYLIASLAFALSAGPSAVMSDGPYAAWSHGPPNDAEFFPIAVWLQSPRNAGAYKAAGINVFVGLWHGPTDEQLDQLKVAVMKVVCAQNQVALKRIADDTIIGWMLFARVRIATHPLRSWRSVMAGRLTSLPSPCVPIPRELYSQFETALCASLPKCWANRVRLRLSIASSRTNLHHTRCTCTDSIETRIRVDKIEIWSTRPQWFSTISPATKLLRGPFVMEALAMKRSLVSVAILLFAVTDAWASDHDVTYIDLQPKSNQKLAENFHNGAFEGNNLHQLPKGESVFADIKFKIDDGLIQLGCKYVEDRPNKVGDIKVGKKFAKLYILHATGFGAFGKPGDALYIEDGTAIGRYTVKYEDNSEEIIPVVYGEDVRDWFNHDGSKAVPRGKVAWEGENDFARQFGVKLRLYRTEWKNPKPDKKVISIDYEREGESVAAPFCVAMTAVEK